MEELNQDPDYNDQVDLKENRKIFIGGIPRKTQESFFIDVFRRYGDIEDIVLIRSKETNEPRGFGFVTYCSKEDYERVLNTQVFIGERLLDLKPATPRGQTSDEKSQRDESRGSKRPFTKYPSLSEHEMWSSKYNERRQDVVPFHFRHRDQRDSYQPYAPSPRRGQGYPPRRIPSDRYRYAPRHMQEHRVRNGFPPMSHRPPAPGGYQAPRERVRNREFPPMRDLRGPYNYDRAGGFERRPQGFRGRPGIYEDRKPYTSSHSSRPYERVINRRYYQ